MALTNFANLTTEQKTIWSMDLWKMARNYSFINKFLGSDANSLVHHVTELKKSEKGARAVLTLLADLTGDGVAGDRNLEGNEEAMQTSDKVIRIDQLRHANRHEGRMADQKSIVEFRSNSRDVLAYWMSDRIDQMAFLTMAGISYTLKPNGLIRTGSDLPFLEFAQDVTAPTSLRFGRWDNTNKVFNVGAGSNTVVAGDYPAYELFLQLKAFAKEQYIRGVKENGGEETYHAFLTPTAMAKLRQDPTFMLNLRHAQERGDKNPLFTGSVPKLNGIYFHEYRHVPSTAGALSGAKYGAGGTVDGCNILFCGAQALGMADIGNPEWVEKGFDYENSQGISVGKILGFLKPQFLSIYASNTVQDFGVINVYTAQ